MSTPINPGDIVTIERGKKGEPGHETRTHRAIRNNEICGPGEVQLGILMALIACDGWRLAGRRDVLAQPQRQAEFDSSRLSGEKLLTQAEAATLTGLSLATIRRRIASGDLRAYRLGPRCIRVDRDDLAAMYRAVGEA